MVQLTELESPEQAELGVEVRYPTTGSGSLSTPTSNGISSRIEFFMSVTSKGSGERAYGFFIVLTSSERDLNTGLLCQSTLTDTTRLSFPLRSLRVIDLSRIRIN